MKKVFIRFLSVIFILLNVNSCSSGDDNDKQGNKNYELNSFDINESNQSQNNKQALKDSLSHYNKNNGGTNNGKNIPTQPISNYHDARSVFWKKLYNEGGETLYCGESFGRGYNDGINIEHVFPMSWVTKSLRCGQRKECRQNSKKFNQIESDLHNLFPSRSDINQARRSFAFGIINGEKREFGRCDFELSGRPTLVEPRDVVRGDIARAMFYMADTYPELNLFDKQIELLKQWNQSDKVSDSEKWRNDKIESIQGNRNPFIDNPSLINERF